MRGRRRCRGRRVVQGSDGRSRSGGRNPRECERAVERRSDQRGVRILFHHTGVARIGRFSSHPHRALWQGPACYAGADGPDVQARSSIWQALSRPWSEPPYRPGVSRRSGGLHTRHHQPPLRPPTVDQLLGGQSRPRTQVCEVPLRRARPDTDARRGLGNRAARRDEGGEDVDLTSGRRPREQAAQVAASHR